MKEPLDDQSRKSIDDLLDLIAQLIAREHYQSQIRSTEAGESTHRAVSDDSKPQVTGKAD